MLWVDPFHCAIIPEIESAAGMRSNTDRKSHENHLGAIIIKRLAGFPVDHFDFKRRFPRRRQDKCQHTAHTCHRDD